MEPKIDKCPHCQHERPWSLWVLAHWGEVLHGKCEKCGEKYSVCRGIAMKLKSRKQKEATA